MALVIQTKLLTPSYVPYERPSQPATLWTAIPRGLQSFISAGTQLEAKPVNDTFILSMTATLPPNFAYVMADINVTISQDRAVDWDNKLNLNLQNFYRANESLALGLSGNYGFEFPTMAIDNTQRNILVNQALPGFPIVGTQGTSGAQIVVTAWNSNVTVAATGTIDAFVSFWQFDLEQIRKYPINSPIPVHSR